VSQGAMQPMRLRPGLVRQGQLSPVGLPAQITQRDLIGEPTVTDGILDDQDDVRPVTPPKLCRLSDHQTAPAGLLRQGRVHAAPVDHAHPTRPTDAELEKILEPGTRRQAGRPPEGGE